MVRPSRLLRLLFLLTSLASQTLGIYTLSDDYSADKFFSMHTFFTDDDPTKGNVNYVGQAQAQSLGLISSDNNKVVMRVDSTTPVATGKGRNSIRVQSNKTYGNGLWIADIAHMPSGCGGWPAWWATSSQKQWPAGGEIDIVENVNEANTNFATLHTGGTGQVCSYPNQTLPHSHATSLGCDINSPGQGQNVGCAFNDNRANSWGAGFNSNNGGVYAMLRTADAISVYFFARGSIPSDVLSNSPNPANWGKPSALWSGGSAGCGSSIDDQQQQIWDISLCGSWAGTDWSTSSCASKAATCDEYVRNTPSALKEMYWEINSLKVYNDNGAVAASAAAPEASPPAASTAAQPASSAAATPISAAASISTATTPPQEPTAAAPVIVVTETVTAPVVAITANAALPASDFGTGSPGISARMHARHLR